MTCRWGKPVKIFFENFSWDCFLRILREIVRWDFLVILFDKILLVRLFDEILLVRLFDESSRVWEVSLNYLGWIQSWGRSWEKQLPALWWDRSLFLQYWKSKMVRQRSECYIFGCQVLPHSLKFPMEGHENLLLARPNGLLRSIILVWPMFTMTRAMIFMIIMMVKAITVLMFQTMHDDDNE